MHLAPCFATLPRIRIWHQLIDSRTEADPLLLQRLGRITGRGAYASTLFMRIFCEVDELLMRIIAPALAPLAFLLEEEEYSCTVLL